MTSTNGEQFEITSGPTRAVVNEVGAGLRVCESAGVPLVQSYPADEPPPMGAGAILLPWPNRVDGGRWEWRGKPQQLAITEPARDNAIHGLVRELAWRRTGGGDAAAVTLEAEVAAQDGWPVPLHTTVRYAVGDGGLRATHTVTNAGDDPVPFGLGVHPYVRAGHAAIDACVLRLAATTVQPVDPVRQLPDGPPAPVDGTDLDFRDGRPLAGVELDLPFGGCVPTPDPDDPADGPLLVRHTLTGPGGGVVVWADPVFSWVQVFTSAEFPGADRVVAVEPTTCPPDALRSGTDLITLEPGETWSASWGLRALT